MSISFGNCCGCGKGIKYERVNVCKECEDKYIDMIIKYARENGYKVETEVLHQELGIPYKVLKLFEMNGFLQSIAENKEIEKDKEETEEDSDKKSRLAVLNELRNSIKEEPKKIIIEESKPTGPRMYTHKPIKR